MNIGSNGSITLVLDDESGNLKSAHEALVESGRENVIYASSAEEARSGLNGGGSWHRSRQLRPRFF